MLDDFGLTSNGDTTFIYSNNDRDGNTIDTAYYDWVVAPKVRPGLSINDTTPIAGPDTATIRYRGTGYSIPINFGLYYNYLNFRFGLGGTYEIHRLRPLKPKGFEDEFGDLVQTETRLSLFRYYLLLGYTYDRYRYFDFSAEVLMGMINYGGDFDNTAISGGFFFNAGVKIERNLSELFAVYVKPSVEFKGYRMQIGDVGTIRHNQPAVFLNFGATFRFPSLRKCPVPSCHTQINHRHNGVEVRSRRHKFWKWQNPKYGENYRNLILYKGKNKKIRDPY
jgi:hypothetical protein